MLASVQSMTSTSYFETISTSAFLSRRRLPHGFQDWRYSLA